MVRIEICGCIASGKTTLCKALTSKLVAPIYEDFRANPFLDIFYKNPAKVAFETELTFLLQHYHGIKMAVGHNVLTDYSIILDMAYADVTLQGQQRKVFLDVAQQVLSEIGMPDLLISLECPAEVLFERVQKRNRESEKAISIQYLKELSAAAQERVAAVSKDVQVISLDSHLNNFLESQRVVEKIDLNRLLSIKN